MSTSVFSNRRWTNSEPPLYFDLSYESERSGANMRYKFYFNFRALQGYFGYQIHADLKLNNASTPQISGALIKDTEPLRWYDSNTVKWTSSWITVSNVTAGTVPLSFRLYGGESRDVSYTANLAVIPAGATFRDASNNATIGTARTIAVTRYSTEFTHTLTFTAGNYTQTIATNSTATSISWTPADAIAAQNTEGFKVNGTLRLVTKDGSTTVGDVSQACTVTIPTYTLAAPSAPTFSERASLPHSYGGAYVQNKSSIRANMSGKWTAKYSGTLAKITITFDGARHVGAANTSYVDGLVPTHSGAVAYSVTVTDSRGVTSPAKTGTVTIAAYAEPRGTLKAYRSDSSGNPDVIGDHIKFVVNGTVVNVNNAGTNAHTFRVKTAPVGSSTWTTRYTKSDTYVVSNYTPNWAADMATAYQVKLEITDDFATTTIGPYTVPKALVWLQGADDGKGFAFGEPAVDGEGRINMPLKVTGAVTTGAITANGAVTASGNVTTDGNVISHGGNILTERNSFAVVAARNTTNGATLSLHVNTTGSVMGLYDETEGAYLVSKNTSTGAISFHGTVSVAHGGTGATTAAAARENLGIAATQLYSGSLSSGSITFSKSYKFFVIMAKPGSAASTGALVVPSAVLTTSDVRYQVADESAYRGISLKYSGSTVTLTAVNGSGTITKVYGIN